MSRRTTSNPNPQPSVVDLFAGAGGLSLGFVSSGFELVCACDDWLPAVETHRANFGETFEKTTVTRDLDLPESSVIVGGPPCQGFSSAGPRRSDDSRNSLVGEFSRLIAKRKPTAFVFENVEGFITSSQGHFLFELLVPLIEAGYRIHLRKINAANYGVPQHRKRVLAIGGLGWDPTFPRATHAAFGAPGAHLGNGRNRVETPNLEAAIGSAGESTHLEDHAMCALVGDDLIRARLLEPGQQMRDLPEEYWHKSYRRRAFRRVIDGTPTERRGGAPSGIRRLRWDEPCKAITSGSLRDFIHPDQHRPLTVRECALIQTFPADFRFLGTKSERMKLIGNAVPPVLAESIASALREDLRHAYKTNEEGALLSFVPTLSTGMSPILKRVTEKVRARFGIQAMAESSELLWH